MPDTDSSADPSPGSRQPPASTPAGELLSGLEDLFKEEGLSLEATEEESPEDELADLFSDTGDPSAAGAKSSGPASAAPPARQRLDTRSARQSRRSRDLETFRSLEVQMRLDPMGVEVAEDRLSASLSRVTAEDTFEEIIRLLANAKITSGIDHEGIRVAMTKAARGQPVYGVTAARGRSPRLAKPAEVEYRLPPEMLAPRKPGSATEFERLKQFLAGPNPEALNSWRGAVRVVRPDEVIAELVPAQVEPGEDVFGEPVFLAAAEKQTLTFGDNAALSEDGTRVTATVFGYAGLIEGTPTVLPPIWISEDHMEARFVYLSCEGRFPVPTPQDIEQLLQLFWVEYGVMTRQIELILQRLSRGQALSTSLPIAQGAREVAGENAQIQYAFDTYSVLSWSQLQGLWGLPTPEAVAAGITELYADGTAPRLTAFREGAVVVEKTPATEGIPGKDIQGEEIIPQEGQDVPLEVGDNLMLAEDRLRGQAVCFGYACLKWDIQPTLISPLWIAPDKSVLYYVNLPQTAPARYPTLEGMMALLSREGIAHGFHAERWVENLQALESGQLDEAMVLVASGTRAQTGRDAAFEWAIEIPDRSPGKMQEDGSIDFRERSLTTVVKQGDLIGRLIPPLPGTPGKDLLDRPVQPTQSVSIEVVTDSRISAKPSEDGVISFHAAVGGGVARETRVQEARNRSQQRIHLGIYPISNIEHDVDYSTGNVDFNGDVVIGGSVHAQFTVRATGTVSIGGYVEAGACVTAGKDILIKRGVVGSTTELVASGDVMAKYIQEATIRAGGDVKAGSYIFNASIRAGGQVVVAGKGEGKSRALVGGLVWAGKGITARSIGSPYNTSTRLVVGIDPEYVNRADQIRANMQACDEKQQKLLRSVGLDSTDLALIRQRLARCRTPKEKQGILSSLKRVAKVAELEQGLQQELNEIAETQRKLAFRATANVQNELFAGVELRIGEETLTLHDDDAKVSFRLVQEDEQLSIQKGPFKGNLR